MHLKISHKMLFIGLLGLTGMLVLGGLGYLSVKKLTSSANAAFEESINVRSTLTDGFKKAQHSEQVARSLGDLNRRLIHLMEQVIKGPRYNISEEELTAEAEQLLKDAQMIKKVPGQERLFKGTKNTLGDVTLSNFEDIGAMFEFDLPDYYASKGSPEEFKARQGEFAVGLANLYGFISKNLTELASNSLKEVEATNQQLKQVKITADLETKNAGAELRKTANSTTFGLLIVLIITIVILGVAFITFARSMTQPLLKTVSMANQLQKGHVSERLTIGDRQDEFGEMAAALNQFADDLEHEVVSTMQKFADGNFNINVQPNDQQDLIRTALLHTTEKLSQALAEIQSASERIEQGSVQVSESAQLLSEGATSSAASIEEISASMNEMANHIKINAENANQANDHASKAQNVAETGNQKMQQMVEAMVEIRDSSQDISKIIKSIDEIAFQTNLLALNAAVEAARAGQHGKGFAVVAEEVRNLAARSAKAASETTLLIQAAADKTESGVNIANQTAQALNEIVASIATASGLTADIAKSSDEQSLGIEQINQGLTRIDQVIQTNTASSEESAATSEDLAAQAALLKSLLANFQIKFSDHQNRPSSPLLS